MSVRVRRAQAAGLFYPDDPEELRTTVEGLLKDASAPAEVYTEELRALIVPHAGYVYSGPVAATGYKLLQLQRSKFSKSPRVLLLGPAHFVAFSGAATHPADFWETPLGRVPVVNPGVPLGERGPLLVLAEAHEREHSLEVQLPFLQVALEVFEIFPLVTGFIRAEMLAQALNGALKRFDLIIVSSDLSHYHPDARAREIDAVAHRVITELDVEGAEQRLDACGKTAICALLRWAKARGWRAELLDYKTSGDTAGDRSSVVGYGCYGFFA